MSGRQGEDQSNLPRIDVLEHGEVIVDVQISVRETVTECAFCLRVLAFDGYDEAVRFGGRGDGRALPVPADRREGIPDFCFSFHLVFSGGIQFQNHELRSGGWLGGG